MIFMNEHIIIYVHLLTGHNDNNVLQIIRTLYCENKQDKLFYHYIILWNHF